MILKAWYEPYALNDCPRCGGLLGPVDGNLIRSCVTCRISVEPALHTLHDNKDDPVKPCVTLDGFTE